MQTNTGRNPVVRAGSVIGRPRILIVEDEAITAMELANQLRDEGYVPSSVCHDAAAAIESGAARRPDLLLADIRLGPGLDGIDAAAEIKATVDVPVVFLTAYSDDATIRRAESVGPHGYVLKPYCGKSLALTLRLALQQHDAEVTLNELLDALPAQRRELSMTLREDVAQSLAGIHYRLSAETAWQDRAQLSSEVTQNVRRLERLACELMAPELTELGAGPAFSELLARRAGRGPVIHWSHRGTSRLSAEQEHPVYALLCSIYECLCRAADLRSAAIELRRDGARARIALKVESTHAIDRLSSQVRFWCRRIGARVELDDGGAARDPLSIVFAIG